jgi:iron(III) transport system substrate-binding protein
LLCNFDCAYDARIEDKGRKVMTGGAKRRLKGFMILGVVLSQFVLLTARLGATETKPKQGAQAQGSLYVASHDEIVARAKEEGLLRGVLGFEVGSIKAIKEGFAKKYPFIKTDFSEISGTNSAQRFLLELKGRRSDWDIAHMSTDFHGDYLPYMERLDLKRMAENGVLQIRPEMIDPKGHNTLAASSIVDVAAYNKKLLPNAQIPKSWDDFLKPEYKGRKFAVDIRPLGLAGLVPAMGQEWVVNFARSVKSQDPIWVNGSTRGLTAMASGDFPLFMGTYYHSVIRLQTKGGEVLEALPLQPIPVRLLAVHGIVKGAKHPCAALLFLEYVSSAEAQKLLDELEPLKSSIYSPGAKLEQLVRGKKVSVVDWDHIEKMGTYMKQISQAYGFPVAAK